MVTPHDDIAAKVEQFIRSRFRVLETDSLFSHDVDLFDSGYVDSVGVVEMISFLEATFEIKVPEDSLFSDEFTTIDGISKIVQSCMNAVSSESGNGHAVAAPDDDHENVSPLTDREGPEEQGIIPQMVAQAVRR